MRSPFTRTATWLAALVLFLGLSPAGTAAVSRLEDIRARGALTCGIWPYVPGFASERDGHYVGFEIDFCRAIAAAIFGDAAKVELVTLAHVTEFAARKEIDLVVRRLTWTPGRERASGTVFGPIIYYDGQGLLVPKNGGIRTPAQLAGERVCVINMEGHPATLRNYFHDSGREVQLVMVDSDRAAEDALRRNRCRAYSADISWLAAARSSFAQGRARYEILPQQISKEPLAPLMRAEDTELVDLVRWTVFAMITAEELGLTSHNIGSEPRSSAVRSFLDVHPGSRVAPGAGEWVRAIIAGVGNYGEVFERNLGASSPIGLERGPNRLWSEGGLMYAPPLER